ncbi:MAG: dihydrouridine synthase, partial [Actinomycetota bacterium]|nr:dihydrouridine synthase [Actinomycetota bacterium]
WVIDRAEEHLGRERGARYLRKFYPWYLDRLGVDKGFAGELQQTESIEDARRAVDGLIPAALAS